MTLAEFRSSLKGSNVPENLSVELESLWYDGKGDWNRSHEVIQDVNSKNAAWIHAYLHRKEGDLSNARYWYSRAGQSMPVVSLNDEWTSLVRHFLES